VCVECLIGKQKKPILFKVTEPSSIPYRTPPACAKRAAYPDPPPVILLPSRCPSEKFPFEKIQRGQPRFVGLLSTLSGDRTSFAATYRACFECLIGKQKKPILFEVTEPSSVPYRAPPACAKRAAYPDHPPVILLPESIAAQAAYQLRYKNTEYYSWVSSGPKC